MELKSFSFDVDSEGIAVVVWDMPDRSMNLLTEETIAEIGVIAGRLEDDSAITGLVITSGKPAFCAGADLAMMEAHTAKLAAALESGEDPREAVGALFEGIQSFSRVIRRLESTGKPVVAALNGTALGGGFELALACHHRIAADNPKAKLGLPESRVGLLPGGGGTQRLPRLIGAAEALRLMLQGRSLDPGAALKAGLVDAVVPGQDLLTEAKAWIRSHPEAVQRWDVKGWKVPGGLPYSPGGMTTWMAANALYRRETGDNYPAQRAIMSCVYEGLQVPIDTGLRIEARYSTWLLRQPETGAMIRSLFLSMQELGKGARRPPDPSPFKITKLGVLGAGMMGAGIANVSAQAGMEVVLLDRDDHSAARGKAHAAEQLSQAVARGRTDEDGARAVLGRIHPTADFDDLKGCELVIEAVFEDRAIKAEVTGAAEARLAPSSVFASNTSTLPITGLAEASARPDRFIGIHFFSPVEKMMLVEIIVGEQTGEEALAAALDYVRAIRKTPIVVNDSRGFYTSRVVGTYIAEGHHMLAEGIPPALIENAGRMAGMPVGPLALNDEVSIELAYRIAQAAKADLGDAYVPDARDVLLEEMVDRRGRLGRKNAKGFYDYPEEGRKRLWPGLGEVAPVTEAGRMADVEDLKTRFLAIQAVETARCFEEGVLTDVRDADVGAILGWGFAPFTGGPLSYIDMTGPARFVTLCERLAERHGDRYAPNALLKDLASAGELFYTRFDPRGARADAA